MSSQEEHQPTSTQSEVTQPHQLKPSLLLICNWSNFNGSSSSFNLSHMKIENGECLNDKHRATINDVLRLRGHKLDFMSEYGGGDFPII